MGWKDWSYLKRSVIVLFLLHFIFWCVTLLVSLTANDYFTEAYAWIPINILDAPVFWILYKLIDTVPMIAVLILIFGSLQWIIIGAVIGNILERIKKKRE